MGFWRSSDVFIHVLDVWNITTTCRLLDGNRNIVESLGGEVVLLQGTRRQGEGGPVVMNLSRVVYRMDRCSNGEVNWIGEMKSRFDL